MVVHTSTTFFCAQSHANAGERYPKPSKQSKRNCSPLRGSLGAQTEPDTQPHGGCGGPGPLPPHDNISGPGRSLVLSRERESTALHNCTVGKRCDAADDQSSPLRRESSATVQAAEPLPQSGLRLTAIRNLNRRERARLFRLIRSARSLSPLATRASLTSRGSLSYQHPGEHSSPLRMQSNATVQTAELPTIIRKQFPQRRCL